MPIYYFFKQLLMPPGGLLLLLFVGFCWWWRRPLVARSCLFVGFSALWLMSMPLYVEWLARIIETEKALPAEEWPILTQRADAIVILGAGRETNDPAWGEDAPSLLAVERLRYAARLAKVSKLPVLTSGGLHYKRPPSEATLMANSMLWDFGVPVHWQEGRSHTTWENASLSAPLLRAAGVRRVVLVTQAWHMRRARWSFEQQGFEVVTAPVGFLSGSNLHPFGGWLPEAKAFWESSVLFNEVIGLLGYRLFYR